METNAPPRSETRAATDAVVRRFNLSPHEHMQDHDIEMADAARVEEFCTAYETEKMDSDTRLFLMKLIVASLDDRLNFGEEKGANEAEERVERLLRRDFVLHFHTVDYWRPPEKFSPDLEPEEQQFHVSPMMQKVWEDNFNGEQARWREVPG